MKIDSSIIKRIFAWILIVMWMIPMTACARNKSHTDVAMRLDTMQMVETAASDHSKEPDDTLRERVGAPDFYKYESTDGVMTLTANAIVSIPNAESVPVVRTSGADFTQEQIDTLLSLLWQGDTMWNTDRPLTKTQIEEQIASIEYDLQTKADYQDEREKFETIWLPALREKLKSAPEVSGPVRSDGTLTTEFIFDDTTEKVVTALTKLSISGDTGRYLYIRNNADNTTVVENTRNGRIAIKRWATLIYRSSQEEIAYFGTDTMFEGTEVTADERTIPTINAISVGLSPAQAAAVAGNFFSELGEDFSIYDMYLMNVDGRGVYIMRCVRNIHGIPCIIMEGESSAAYVDSEDEELPDAVWAYETVTLFVDETGVCQFEWSSPHRTGETLVEESSLLLFSDIANVCFNILPVLFYEEWGHIDTITSVRIEIDKIEFGMLRVVENQSIDGGLMIPVWAFYGKRGFTAKNREMQNRDSQCLLIVNAIDGSIVNPDKGL